MKIIKYITINLLLVFFTIFLIELFLFTKDYLSIEYEYKFNWNNYFSEMHQRYTNINRIIFKNSFRKPIIPQENSSSGLPIILLGCSFAYGEGLNEDENFSGVLSKFTKRAIYNLARGGHSQKTSLYILRENFNNTNEDILKNNNQVEYVIYTYIDNHLRRLYVNVAFSPVPDYKIVKENNNLHLKYKKNYFYKNLYLYKNLTEFIYKIKMKQDANNVFNIFCLYIKEINNEIKTKFNANGHETQLVILVYQNNGIEDWDILRKEGIIVIDINELLGFDINQDEYQLSDFHPNAKAWEVITPELIKKLNL